MDDTLRCSECGTHFALSPGMVTDGLACPECGGKRLFMEQPSPTQSDGTLRDMVDSDTQIDQGGNPLGEGTIMGNDGERNQFVRDNYMHSNVSHSQELPPLPVNHDHSLTESVMERAATFNTEPYMPWQYDERTLELARRQAGIWDTIKGVGTGLAQHPLADAMGAGAGALALTGVGDLGPAEALGAGAVAEAGAETAADVGATAGEDVAASAAGGAASGEAPAAGDTSTAPTASDEATEDEASKEGGGLGKQVAQGLGKGLGEEAAKGIGGLLKGALGAGAGGALPPASPTPGLVQTGSTKDIPMLLVADFETYDSVPSVDEQNDDPLHQDQKQFDDGDMSPSNFHNPNLEDSGAMGEDNVRSDSAFQTGFSSNSPGIERANMIMPLLMHYYNSPESGERDPLIKGLHESLEQENPGYLTRTDPAATQSLIDSYRNPSPMGVHAGVNAQQVLPGGTPTTGTLPGQAPVNPIPQPQAATGTCPNCGSVLGPDGSCPQCGNGNNGTAVPPMTPGGVAMQGIASHLATHQGPVTPEQIAAVQEVLISQGRDQECPNVPLHPEQYAKEMAEIQQQPNVAPQIDPSQLQQTPPPAMQQAPGSMPVTDPSQAGGGGGQPMQPMSSERTADANTMAPRCPKCGSGTTSVDVGGSPQNLLGSDPSLRCHSCGNIFTTGEGRVAHSLVFAGEVEMANPLLKTDPHMKWADVQGNDLVEGGTYELHSAAFSVPTEVRIMQVKPDGLDVQLTGGVGNATGQPDFKIGRQEAQLEHYEFVPIAAAPHSVEPDNTPGISPEQVPPIETTDETPDVIPHTQSSVVEDPSCQKCGSITVDTRMLSPEVTSHDCVRCANHWETRDEDPGTTASVDLSWINQSDDDDFDFDRHHAMMQAAGTQSRNLTDIASKDTRLQEIKARLDANEKLAGKYFSQSEKRDLIDESGQARNLTDLDLEGTHYDTRVDWSGKANGANVEDDHFALGL